MRSKILTYTILAIIFGLVSCRLCQYQRKIEHNNTEIYKGLYLNNSFTGVIKRIQRHEKTDQKISLSIDTGEEFDLEYAWLIVDNNIIDDLAIGDSLYKKNRRKNHLISETQ